MSNPVKALKGAIRALNADVAIWKTRITETEKLIADLSARAGIDGGVAGTRGTTHAAQAKPVPKRRRRRRRSARRHTPRHGAQRRRNRPDVVEPVQVAAPEPAKAIRGAAQFADQLAELELVRVGLAAAGDDAKIILARWPECSACNRARDARKVWIPAEIAAVALAHGSLRRAGRLLVDIARRQ